GRHLFRQCSGNRRNRRVGARTCSSILIIVLTRTVSIMMKPFYSALLMLAVLSSCGRQEETTTQDEARISDDSLMTLVQYRTFQYFWDGAEPVSGAARERFHTDDVYPQNDKHIITS